MTIAGCRGPGGEPWTIECLELQGPGSRDAALAIADVLRQTEGIDGHGVHVRHDDESTRIYYGKYDRRIDRIRGLREIPEDLKTDLALVKELYDDRGRRIFLGARMVPQPVDDAGPREWDLQNVDGVYSLQVAVFFATTRVPDYKQAAADYVSALRKKGYQAYYHHGQSKSVVTVGVFGPEAVINRQGQLDYSNQVRELQRKEDFAYNLNNGAVWKAIVDGHEAQVRSLLVRIPPRPEPNP